MACQALRIHAHELINVHFISSADGSEVLATTKKLNPETTLVIIASKSFTTTETTLNTETTMKWLKESLGLESPQSSTHVIAVTENIKKAKLYGIEASRILELEEWVGGRFSLWSGVGLSISLAVGFDNYKALLEGAEEMDIHYRSTPFDKNIPVILALISIWYNNFYLAETEAVLPYSQYLKKLPDYLQQAIMESNGKGVDRNGDTIDYQTGTIVWGSTGTNMQHAFMQLVHQGTKLIPADFIGYKESLYGLTDHHKKLMANYYGQMEALAFGKSKEEVHLELKFSGDEDKISTLLPFKVFEGNRPSNAILFEKLTPRSLGRLVALYEHKIYTQGILWNIYSFDQFGVELGKELAKKLLNT
jgi:glucose-6-phosphate isomerase